MRISTAYRFDYFSSTVSQTSESMFAAQQRVSTGKRILSPTDDPAGTSLSLHARDLQASLAQYGTNISNAKLILGTSDNEFSAVNDLLNSAKSIALRGANGTNSKEAMGALAVSIQQMSSDLLNHANAQMADGQYVFAGQSTNTKPFSVSNGQITYSGDTGDVKYEVAPGNTMAVNSQASGTFVDIYNAFKELGANLSANNPGAISGSSLQKLDALISKVNVSRGELGARSQTLDSLNTQHLRRTDELANSISNVEDVDMAKAISDYQQANTAYQAALTVSSQSSKLSLMDFIK